jgi:hypothetical protein
MRLRAGNTDRLKDVFFIKRIRETAALGRCPFDGVVGELRAFRLCDRGGRLTRRGAREIAANGSRHDETAGGLRGDRASGRNAPADPAEQRRHVGRDTCGRRKLRWVGRRHAIDDRQPRLDHRAMLGIDRAIDRRGEDDGATLLQADKGIAPSQRLGAEIGAGDRHQPPAADEARQR